MSQEKKKTQAEKQANKKQVKSKFGQKAKSLFK